MSQEPKTVETMGAQGDLFFRKISKLPEGLEAVEAEDGHYVVAHSETGHNHTAGAIKATYYLSDDPMVCYLKIDGDYTDLIHHRSFDTHAPLRLTKGIWELRRQREYTPEGWRMVED